MVGQFHVALPDMDMHAELMNTLNYAKVKMVWAYRSFWFEDEMYSSHNSEIVNMGWALGEGQLHETKTSVNKNVANKYVWNKVTEDMREG